MSGVSVLAAGKLSRQCCLIRAPSITGRCSSRGLSQATASDEPRPITVDDEPPSAVTEIINILKTQGDESWESNPHLNQFLFRDSSSGTDFLEITRRLGTSSAALKFVEHLRSSKPSTSLPPDAESRAIQGVFDLASREPGSADKLWSLLQVSKEMGIPLTTKSAVLLIRHFGRAGMIDRSMAVYHELPSEMRNWPVRSTLLEAMVYCGRLQDARKLLDEMLQPDSDFPLNARAASSLLRKLLLSAKNNRNNNDDDEDDDDDELVALLLRLGGRGVFPDTITLAQTITAMCKGGRVRKAWKLLVPLMKLEGSRKAAPPFNALLSCLGRNREFEKMKLLMNEMKENGVKPDVVTCGILINRLCKSGRMDDALELLEKMRQGGGGGELAKPDVVIYNTVIDGLCKVGGRLEEGLALLGRMRSSSSSLECRPNRVTYNCVIDGLCTAGEIEKALGLVDQMKEEGMKPDRITMNSLIGGMCRHGRICSAVKLFSEMKGKGVEGDQVTYTKLINGYCGVGNIDKGMELFDEMRGKMKPDAIVYFTLISGLCQCGRMEDAISMLSVMREAGFRPDIVCYNSMISGFCRKNQAGSAYELLKEMKGEGTRPDCTTYNIMISYFGKKGDLGMVERLWKKMVGARIEPTVMTYGALIHAHCLAGDIDAGMKVLRGMMSGGIQPSTVMYNILIDSLCKKGEVEAAISLFDEMGVKGVRPDASTFNAMLKGLMELNLLEKAFELMDMMVDQGCNPDYVTMDILTEWLSAVGETDRLRNFVVQCRDSTKPVGRGGRVENTIS